MPLAPATAELRERGSRFYAHLSPADSPEIAKRWLAELAERYADATHVCFAWRIGWPPAERAADAGEPAGTAGAPILGALRAAGLTDLVAAVARYFGGTKLGRGGLVRAYGGVTRAAVADLPTRTERPRVRVALSLPHERIGAVRRLLRTGRVEIESESYGGRADLVLTVAEEAWSGVEAALADLGIDARQL